jgi:hypothetical protein
VSDDERSLGADERSGAAPTRAAVFVSDPSAEAERVAQHLRAAGYSVVDVPLSMLAARVAVQRPRAVVVDADAAGVVQALAAVRRAGGDPGIDVLLLGDASSEARALADETCHFFLRPVDPRELVTKVTALTVGPRSERPGASGRAGPTSLEAPSTTAHPWPSVIPDPRSTSSAPPSAPASGLPAPSSSPLRDSPISARSARPAISIRTTLSAELEALLMEAEQRIGSQLSGEVVPPTPEEEIEAVLPEALLAALDEPIDEEDDDAIGEAPRSRAVPEPSPAAVEPAAAETNAGRTLTPLPSRAPSTVALGVAPTMAAPPMPVVDVEPEAIAAPPERPRSLAVEATGSVAVTLLREGDAPRLLAAAIASRRSGCLTVESEGGLRRIVLREGDLVTSASSADDETLLAFLTSRGDLRREQVKDLLGKVPPFGRHAGAALVGHGILPQDQLWPSLRSHAEWVTGRLLLVGSGSSRFEAEAPGRLRQEPSVFGGSSGAEVLVEVTRRVIAPEEALRRLGGGRALFSEGPGSLLHECALEGHDRARVEAGRGLTIEELIGEGASADMASVLYALSLLGVIVVTEPAPVDFAARAGKPAPEANAAPPVDVLDLAAVRERVRARSDLVAEADYFTLLGVPRAATGYEVRRAYLELRRAFEPSRILTPELADLEADVRTIVAVLDEAYDILRDSARRERYRRALGDSA